MLSDPRMYEMPDVPCTGRIRYFNDEAPGFTMPEHRGTHQVKMMPATLDLQERARLCINAMTAPTDPEIDYELYWLVNFQCNPPRMYHSMGDRVEFKFMVELPLLRRITGCRHNIHVDERRIECFLKGIADDGLHYWPIAGRPWNRIGSINPDLERVSRNSIGEGAYYTDFVDCGFTLGLIAAYYRLTGDDLWLELGKKTVKGTRRYLTEHDDGVSINGTIWCHGRKPVPRSGLKLGPNGFEDNAAVDIQDLVMLPQNLIRFYVVSGYEPALELARKINKTWRKQNFGENGEYTSYNHFHYHTYALYGYIEQAAVDGDEELWEFVRRAYEWGRSRGVPETGYFPEYYDTPKLSTCELCEVAEMVVLPMWLSRHGLGDYWDDADRYIRNQFFAGQLIDTDFIYRTTAPLAPSEHDPVSVTAQDVPERNVGAFAGWATGSQWGGNIMHCCTGSGARTINYISDSIVTNMNGEVQINLLLNHVTPDVIVMSHIPYAGRVDVEVKRRKRISLRLAEGVEAKDARVTVDGADLSPRVDGRYLDLGEVDAGKTVTVTFPLQTEIRQVWVEKSPYRYTFKGTTVIEAFPREELGDLYNRVHYRHPHALWKETDLFLPEEKLDWSPKVDGQ